MTDENAFLFCTDAMMDECLQITFDLFAVDTTRMLL
jgi:hypothetical protein